MKEIVPSRRVLTCAADVGVLALVPDRDPVMEACPQGGPRTAACREKANPAAETPFDLRSLMQAKKTACGTGTQSWHAVFFYTLEVHINKFLRFTGEE
ncbi:hypothetical protein J27TS7_34730 [Paenibacillus dendritiformis]|nr:hypothetical protein J27TS7_34730 [Paenibacillus dendritiformis]